jgi:hypothetical protein
MPTEASTNFDEKSLLYKLCDFLLTKRIYAKGLSRPVDISRGEFMEAVGDYIPGSNENAKWLAIAEELVGLLEYEENERGARLIRFADKNMTISKMKTSIPAKKITFIYKREDMGKYVDGLKAGDHLKKVPKKKVGGIIGRVELLEDESELKRITIYVNGDYDNPLEFRRSKYYALLYALARDGMVPYEKGFFDYLNSNAKNPLYKKHGFCLSKILKQEGDEILPNVPIVLRTQKFISQSVNKISPKAPKLKSA